MKTKLAGALCFALCVFGALCLLPSGNARAQGATPEPAPNPTITALEKRIDQQDRDIKTLSEAIDRNFYYALALMLASVLAPALVTFAALFVGNRKVEEIPSRVESHVTKTVNQQVSLKLHQLNPLSIVTHIPVGRGKVSTPQSAGASAQGSAVKPGALSEYEVFERSAAMLNACGFQTKPFPQGSPPVVFWGVLIWPIDPEKTEIGTQRDIDRDGKRLMVATDELHLRAYLDGAVRNPDECAIVVYSPRYSLKEATFERFQNIRTAQMLTSITDAVFSAARSLAQVKK
jgi:hypothetical protein